MPRCLHLLKPLSPTYLLLANICRWFGLLRIYAFKFDQTKFMLSSPSLFTYVVVVCKWCLDWVLNHQFTLQPGSFDLVGSIVYEIDKTPYQSTFYNGTIEVVEVGGLFSIETVFLVMLAIGLLVALGLWIHGQLQRFSKVHGACPYDLCLILCLSVPLSFHPPYHICGHMRNPPTFSMICVLQFFNMNVLPKLVSWLLVWVLGNRVRDLGWEVETYWMRLP